MIYGTSRQPARDPVIVGRFDVSGGVLEATVWADKVLAHSLALRLEIARLSRRHARRTAIMKLVLRGFSFLQAVNRWAFGKRHQVIALKLLCLSSALVIRHSERFDLVFQQTDLLLRRQSFLLRINQGSVDLGELVAEGVGDLVRFRFIPRLDGADDQIDRSFSAGKQATKAYWFHDVPMLVVDRLAPSAYRMADVAFSGAR